MTDLTGAERVVADAWIEEAILSRGEDLNDIALGLPARIYEGIAPKSAAYPFITYQCQDDPVDVLGVGTVSIMSNTQYLIKVTTGVGYEDGGRVLAILHSVLTTSTGFRPPVGGTVLSSVRERGFSATEVVDGRTIRTIGGFYNMQVVGRTGDEPDLYIPAPRWYDLTGDLPFPPEAKPWDYGFDGNSGKVWQNNG